MSKERVLKSMNRLAKWRSVFAGWQLGTRPDTDPECQAVRDHREVTLILRAEVSGLVGLLVEKGVFTPDEFTNAVANEAELLSRHLEGKFPGFQATDIGMQMTKKAAETTKGWYP